MKCNKETNTNTGNNTEDFPVLEFTKLAAEVIKDRKFDDFLQVQIDAYNHRPLPRDGLRYKRTPFDGLNDAGKFNVESIRDEFIKMSEYRSQLPRSQRDAIHTMALSAIRQMIEFRKEEANRRKPIIDDKKS
jgi:hypothetical protein